MRQLLVLAADLVESRVLGGQPVVVGLERGVVHPEPVDLGEAAGDRRDRCRHAIQRSLDRPEGESDPLWTSRTVGFDENAMSITEIRSSTRNANPRRRVARVATTELTAASDQVGPTLRSARRPKVRLGDEDAVIASTSWRTWPVPRATHVSGSSAM